MLTLSLSYPILEFNLFENVFSISYCKNFRVIQAVIICIMSDKLWVVLIIYCSKNNKRNYWKTFLENCDKVWILKSWLIMSAIIYNIFLMLAFLATYYFAVKYEWYSRPWIISYDSLLLTYINSNCYRVEPTL